MVIAARPERRARAGSRDGFRAVAAVRSFLERLPEAPARALLIDYDGTLAPFRARREEAAPYPGLRALLLAVARAPAATRVWIVSGRPTRDLSRLTRLAGHADLWGSHGMERATLRAGRIRPASPARARLRGIARRVEAAAAVEGGHGILERKPYGLAIHRRGADAAAYASARRELRRQIAGGACEDFALAPFDGGLELRPKGVHKGLVVDAAFAELGPGAAVAYLGDDRTDEDAFRAIAGRGLSVLVRPRRRATWAQAWLRPPDELAGFLRRWIAACSGDRA